MIASIKVAPIKFIIFLLIVVSSIFTETSALYAQNTFSPRQSAWLYRVYAKTQLINRICDTCFKIAPSMLINPNPKSFGPNYNLVEAQLIEFPDSLTINMECLRAKPHGVLAELAIKTTIWEMAFHLRRALSELPFTNDSIYNLLAPKVIKSLPKKLQNNPKSKNCLTVLKVVMHPSLPFSIKREYLNKLNITPEEQLKTLNEWSDLVADWIDHRSNIYFNRLAGPNNHYQIRLLAAGDGSGTSGILNEYEPHPTDSTRYGYAIGNGLFTYQYRIKNQIVSTFTDKNITADLPNLDTTAIHCSLFGLDTSRKPIIVFTLNNKSYHLFTGNGALTPNAYADDGISHIDRMEQVIKSKINKPLNDLDKEGGLNSILSKELILKQNIEYQIKAYEQQIDSIQRITPVNQITIDSNKRKISTLLTSLTAKERRITELSRKIASEHSKIEASQNTVAYMAELLGPNPQSYTQIGHLYYFNDGLIFDEKMQDLLIPRSLRSNEIKVCLIPASITQSGNEKDEVQLFINLTKPNFTPVNETHKIQKKLNDTTLWCYYKPDEFAIDTTSFEFKTLRNYLSMAKSVNLVIDIEKIDKAPVPKPVYKNRERELQHPITSLGKQRYTKLIIETRNDTLNVTIFASTDKVSTQLSKATPQIRNQLGVKQSNWTNNNLLALLRAAEIVKQIGLTSPKIETKLAHKDLEIYWQIIMNEP